MNPISELTTAKIREQILLVEIANLRVVNIQAQGQTSVTEGLRLIELARIEADAPSDAVYSAETGLFVVKSTE